MQWILNKNSKKNIKTEEKNQGHNCRKPSETAVKAYYCYYTCCRKFYWKYANDLDSHFFFNYKSKKISIQAE